jgi:hypothetical protein
MGLLPSLTDPRNSFSLSLPVSLSSVSLSHVHVPWWQNTCLRPWVQSQHQKRKDKNIKLNKKEVRKSRENMVLHACNSSYSEGRGQKLATEKM